MFSLDQSQVYDVECLPNVFTLTAEFLHSPQRNVWEISQYRDDRVQLFQYFDWCMSNQIPMIGFYSLSYDYPMIHFINTNRGATPAEIYAKSSSMIGSNDRWAHMIWDRDRFAPQIDLARVHHFDNPAKATSLKALEINMRSPSVRECGLPFDQPAAQIDIDRELIPYNGVDVAETKRFAHISMKALDFRIGMIEQFGTVDVMNWNDGKIGAKLLEQRLGEDVCYERKPVFNFDGSPKTRWDGEPITRRSARQTYRHTIPVRDIIFPYVQFRNPEFARVLEHMRTLVLTPEDIDDPEAQVKTKGVFKATANVGGLEFHFGTGGVHASCKPQRFVAQGKRRIRDIDVAALYPSVAIVNGLAPEHLGEAFAREYAKLPIERSQHAKGTYANGALKLASNVPWGQSLSKFGIFTDQKYGISIPINGQLMICMLAECLVDVPSLQLIQANTDGITYLIDDEYVPQAEAIEQAWERFTLLKLEYADYSRMWIRDVNNYIAEDTKGKLKQKGAYWHPDPFDYENSISSASPPCWYKDLGGLVVQRAAVAAMVHGIDPATFIRLHTDPFDFMLRAKASAGSELRLGGVPVQKTFRYYMAKDGAALVKLSPPPPGATPGAFKRKNGVTQFEYDRVMRETGGAWTELVCTKNKSVYADREQHIQAGWKVADCCDASRLAWSNIDHQWYINETLKLII